MEDINNICLASVDIRVKLRKLRKFQEISAREFAKQNNLRLGTLQSIENLRCNPTLPMLRKIIDGLGYELRLVKKEY